MFCQLRRFPIPIQGGGNAVSLCAWKSAVLLHEELVKESDLWPDGAVGSFLITIRYKLINI